MLDRVLVLLQQIGGIMEKKKDDDVWVIEVPSREEFVKMKMAKELEVIKEKLIFGLFWMLVGALVGVLCQL